jgi:hypothetical protein
MPATYIGFLLKPNGFLIGIPPSMFLPQLRKITPAAREPALIIDVPRDEYRTRLYLAASERFATPGPLTIFLVGVTLLLLVARQKFRQFRSE